MILYSKLVSIAPCTTAGANTHTQTTMDGQWTALTRKQYLLVVPRCGNANGTTSLVNELLDGERRNEHVQSGSLVKQIDWPRWLSGEENNDVSLCSRTTGSVRTSSLVGICLSFFLCFFLSSFSPSSFVCAVR